MTAAPPAAPAAAQTEHGEAAGHAATPFHHRYFVAHAARARGRVLDYGCGRGGAVALGLARGVDIWGADPFPHNSDDWRAHVVAAARGRVAPFRDGAAPFPDRCFDLVFCNQVLEHVADPAALIADVHRLLRPDGAFMASFPVVETWYEGHVGLYFAHRLGARPQLRRGYFALAHRLGLGLSRENRSRAEWVAFAERVLDRDCFYARQRRLIDQIEARFTAPVEDLAADYMRARRPGAAHLPRGADPLLRALCRRRVGLVIRVRRPDEG